MSVSIDLPAATPAHAGADGSPKIRVLCVTLYADRAEAATFIGLNRTGCDVRICCMPESPYIPAWEAAGITVVPVRFRRRRDPQAIAALRAELGRADYDIVHLLHNRPVSNGLVALREFPRPKVIAYRGIVGNVGMLNPVSWTRYLNPRIDRVICVAEAVRQYFLKQRFLGLRLAPEKFVTIYKGHDVAWYEVEPQDLSAFDIPREAFVIGCVSNWRPRKGIEVLVEAFSGLPPDMPAWLLLVGNMDSKRLDQAIANSPNAARIRKVGYQQSAAAIAAACDVAVLPTLRREGLPKTVIEAMVARVPPIVTDAGGSPELIENGVSGIVVPAGSADALAAAIRELYASPERRRQIGEAARRRIETHFRIGTTVQQTLALYRELLGTREAVAA